MKAIIRNPVTTLCLCLAVCLLLACAGTAPPPAVAEKPQTYVIEASMPKSSNPQTNSITLADGKLRATLTDYLKEQIALSSAPTTPQVIPNKELSDSIITWINKQSDPWGLRNVWQVALGIVLGGLLNFFAIAYTAKKQREREKEIDLIKGNRERDLEHLKATLDQQRQALSLTNQRFEKFDAPLWALFQQSRGVTDGLMQYIHQQSVDKVAPWDALELEFRPDPAGGQRLRVKHNQNWFKFRMLDHMDVLKADPYSKELVEAVLAIGNKKCRIIREHAGYASANGQFSNLLGQYLAHYAILQTLSKQDAPKRYAPESQKVGYYPKGLDSEIKTGFEEATKRIVGCEKACSDTIQKLVALTPSSTT